MVDQCSRRKTPLTRDFRTGDAQVGVKDGENLAFIVGHYKSGSTWLANLLSLHPSVRGVAETHVFRYSETEPSYDACTRRLFSSVAWSEGGTRNLLRHRVAKLTSPIRRLWKPVLPAQSRPTSLLDLSVRQQHALRRTLLRSESKDDYCRRFFEFLHNALGSDHCLVEKTPTNIVHVPRIRRVFPEAKLLAIYRDGRDVVTSERFFLQNERKTSRALADSILAWRRAMEAQIEFAGPYRIFTCSYESLLENGREVTSQLLRFLGLSDDHSAITDMLRRSSFEFTTGRPSGNEDRRSFYRKGCIGDWRNHFTAEEKRVFKELAGDMLVSLGYENDLDW